MGCGQVSRLSRERVGVLGGTFDPVHLGHLAAAEGARHLAGLDRVLLMPAGDPPHKQSWSLASAAHRLAMVNLAVAGNPGLGVITLDLERPGPHYTVQALQLLQAAHPEWETVFLTGLDGLVQIRAWHDYLTLLGGWDIVAVTRPGTALAEFSRLQAELGPERTARIRLLTIPGVDVSGRQLRRLAAQGYPLRYLVPDAVWEYIDRHQLYRGGG